MDKVGLFVLIFSMWALWQMFVSLPVRQDFKVIVTVVLMAVIIFMLVIRFSVL